MTEHLNYDYILKEGILVKEVPAWLKDRIIKLYYERNFFVKYLKIKINDFYESEVRISMQVRHELTNLIHTLHGGAVASMLDVAMNLACASLQKRVLVLEFNTNFTRSAKEGDTVYAIARVIHDGKRTMVVESRVTDENGNIMAKARGTFFVTGQYKEEDTDYQKYFEDKYADDE